MSELSPQAQAVLSTVDEMYWDWGAMSASSASEIAAAALRAIAEHIDDASDGLECQDILRQVADELEGPING